MSALTAAALARRNAAPGDPRHTKRWFSVMQRGDWVCRYCERELDAWTGTIDHVIPVSRGGSNRFANLVAACKPCNHRKADLPVSEFSVKKVIGARRTRVEPKTKARLCARTPYKSRHSAIKAAKKLVTRRAAEFGADAGRIAMMHADRFTQVCSKCPHWHVSEGLR